MAWTNDDGLHLKFGTEKATANVAGEYRTVGHLREIEMDLDLTTLTTTPTVVSDVTFFPDTVVLEEIEIMVTTAATGATATMDLGLQDYDRTTEIDYNGFLAAVAQTALTPVGTKIVINVGSTGAGALVGVANSTPGYITANYTTAAFTAGAVHIVLRYFTP